MEPELEPILENMLLSEKQSSDETHRLLETIVEQAEKNNPEKILEGQLQVLDDIRKKPVTKMAFEFDGVENVVVEGPQGDKGEKGEPGKTPKKGVDYFTKDEIEKIIKEVKKRIPDPKDGKTPEKGKDYFTDKDIALLMKEMTPFLKRGPKGMKGDKGDDAEVDYDFVVDQVLSMIPKPKDGKDGSPDTPEEIISKIKDKFSYNDLKDVPTFPSARDYDFLELKDTPSTFSGQAGKVATVNAAENGLEFTTVSGGGAVDSVNGQTGVVVLDTSDVADTTDARYVSDAESALLGGITASATEINYTAGVTSAIQTQLDSKLASSAYDDATAGETNTGTSTAKYVSPDGLAGSYAGTKSVSIQVTGGTEDVTTGDGKAYITIPESLNGMDLIRAQATVVTAGTTNATTVMIHNKTDAVDMLSGAISIASAGTVGTVGTINTSNDSVATNDVLRIDVDSVSTTAPQGLMVVLEFRLP